MPWNSVIFGKRLLNLLIINPTKETYLVICFEMDYISFTIKHP